MMVRELMSAPATTCREEDTLSRAASLMRECDCGVIPVVDELDSIIGMITDRDICMAAQASGRRLDEIPVAEITSGNVFSVAEDDTLKRAEEVMRVHKVRRLPVVDSHDRIVGVLSLNDIVRAAQQGAAASRGPSRISSTEIMQTLAAIGEPEPAPTPAQVDSGLRVAPSYY